MDIKIQGIHDATMEILSKVGMRFRHPDAIETLEKHGIRVEGDIAYFTEEQLMYWVRKAPSTFTLYARNPAHNIVIGGERTEVAPCYGAPNITDADGKRRNATMQDYINYAKLFEANEDYHVNGGLMVQPSDVDIASSSLAMFYAAITHSEKAQLVTAGPKQYADALIKAGTAFFGGEDEMRANPHMITIVNANSPLMLDMRMTDTLMAFAKAGQPFTVVNCAMAGSTSPMTLAGTIAMINAEVLPVIALAQMVNPGTPVLYGTATTTADMATGQIAIGAPEGALCYKYCARLAKFYELPCRGGGALTDSKLVDAQAGYEAMITLMADFENHMNFVIHSAGILDGYASTSYEKVIQDFEIIRYIKRYMKDIEVNSETIPLGLIEEIGHDGVYLTSEHTFEHCRTESLIPTISSRGPIADPKHRMDERIASRYDQLIGSYTQPECDEDALARVREIFEKAGLEAGVMDQIETM